MGFKLIYRKYKKNVFSTTCKQSFVDRGVAELSATD